MKTKWALLVATVILGIGFLVNSAAQSTSAAEPSPIPTLNLPTLELITATPTVATTTPEATATREMYALTQPPPEDIAEPLLTITALSAMVQAVPTPTYVKLAKDNKPHMIEFFAAWCAPCHKMRPYIERMEIKYGDKLTIDRINVDYQEDLPNKYRVQFIPLIVLVDKDGNTARRLEGYYTEVELEKAIQKFLGIEDAVF